MARLVVAEYRVVPVSLKITHPLSQGLAEAFSRQLPDEAFHLQFKSVARTSEEFKPVFSTRPSIVSLGQS